MQQDVHEGDHAAVAPADHADALLIKEVIVLEHPGAGPEDVLDLGAAIIDLVVEALAVAGAATVVGGDDGITLLEKFANRSEFIVRAEVAVNPLVGEDEEGLLLRAVDVLGNEGHRADDERVLRA